MRGSFVSASRAPSSTRLRVSPAAVRTTPPPDGEYPAHQSLPSESVDAGSAALSPPKTNATRPSVRETSYRTALRCFSSAGSGRESDQLTGVSEAAFPAFARRASS